MTESSRNNRGLENEVNLVGLVRLVIGTLIAMWGIPDGVHWAVVSLVGAAGGGLLLVAGGYMDRNGREDGPQTILPQWTTLAASVAVGVLLSVLFSVWLGPQTSFSLLLPWFFLIGLAAGMVFEGMRTPRRDRSVR